ncbi:MAG: hypothetical protein M8865_03815 [marine benthic group bacterium]|nr:hypothetical protein [Gemmatimonadota bacterium]
MDHIRTGLFALTAIGLISAPAGAQELAEVCGEIADVGHGDWAEFKMEGPQASQVSGVRFAMVDRGDPSELWFELKAQTVQGEQVVQLQVPGFPFKGDQVSAGIVQAMQMPPMRMPDQMLSMMQQQMQSNPMLDVSEQCLGSTLVGEETVDTPAGSMKAWHITAADGNDAWVSGDVPFGIIKGSGGEGAGGGTMVLTAFGSDATSSITGEPQEMPAMPGMAPQD